MIKHLLFSSLLLLTAVTGRASHADIYDVIICGSGGTPEYSQKFINWGERLYRVLVDEFDHDPEKTILLSERPTEEDAAWARADKEHIAEVFATIAKEATEQDILFVYLIGHGSFMRQTTSLNIPGPDVSAENFKTYFEPIAARPIAVVNSASSSAGFINMLSGPDRIICSATKSVEEVNATEFMEFFLQGLEDGSADQNHDERISLLEACQQAAALTDAWYLAEGLIATEHALIDDNGDERGTRLPVVEQGETLAAADQEIDGREAANLYIKNFTFPDSVPNELVAEYLDVLREVELLRADKDTFEATEYATKLEELLLTAAEKHREIRRLSGRLEEPTFPRDPLASDNAAPLLVPKIEATLE